LTLNGRSKKIKELGQREHALNPWFFTDSFMRIINSLKKFKNLELGAFFLLKIIKNWNWRF